MQPTNAKRSVLFRNLKPQAGLGRVFNSGGNPAKAHAPQGPGIPSFNQQQSSGPDPVLGDFSQSSLSNSSGQPISTGLDNYANSGQGMPNLGLAGLPSYNATTQGSQGQYYNPQQTGQNGSTTDYSALIQSMLGASTSQTPSQNSSQNSNPQGETQVNGQLTYTGDPTQSRNTSPSLPEGETMQNGQLTYTGSGGPSDNHENFMAKVYGHLINLHSQMAK